MSKCIGCSKAETARPPAATLKAQAERLQAFMRDYNQERPHEGLRQKTPAQKYRVSARSYREVEPWSYPASWSTRQVSSEGYLKWQGRTRLIGRAFAHERIGLKAKARTKGQEVAEVYLTKHLIGELHGEDAAGMRPAQRSKASRNATE